MAPAVIFAWGANHLGQCCTKEDGGPDVERKPRCINAEVARSIGLSSPVVGVAAGEAHTLFLTGYGDVFACGRSREGQLGFGAHIGGGEVCLQPRILEALRPWRISHVAAGSQHSLAITACGRAFEWGLLLPLEKSGDENQWISRRGGLGKDFKEDLNERQQRIVAASWSRYMRNTNDSEALEAPDSAIRVMADAECKRCPISTPRPCGGLPPGSSVLTAACGFAHSIIALTDGALYGAGYSDKGQLGHGERSSSPHFSLVALPEGVTSASAGAGPTRHSFLACGLNHTAAICMPGGKLFTWGLGVFGQLGLGQSKKEVFIPKEVELPAPVVQVACGDNHTLVLTAAAGNSDANGHGDLYTFGHRDAVGGQSHYERKPEKKQEFGADSGRSVGRIFGGGASCFATAKDDKHTSLLSWGYNQRFQLGRTSAQLSKHKPAEVALPRMINAEMQVFSAGGGHCVTIVEAPACTILSGEVSAPCFGSSALLAALRGDCPFDTFVITRSPGVDAHLGAHRSVLVARCAALISRLVPRHDGWELNFGSYSAACVTGLLEYLYTDFCRAGSDVAAELRPLASELGLDRLAAGAAAATETASVDENIRWVRSALGQWQQVAVESQPAHGGAVESTYLKDLECLVRDGPGDADPGYALLSLKERREGGSRRLLHVARPVLFAVDFFRVLLDGSFAEGVQFRSGDGPVEVPVDDADAFTLCMRMVSTGDYDGVLPEESAALLALITEAHRLDLMEVVCAAESALCRVVAETGAEPALRAAFASGSKLYGLQKLGHALQQPLGGGLGQAGPTPNEAE